MEVISLMQPSGMASSRGLLCLLCLTLAPTLTLSAVLASCGRRLAVGLMALGSVDMGHLRDAL